MATITEQVKESLLGSDQDPQLSATTKKEFLQHAIKDEATGEYYMSEKEFVDAVAPQGEDYVGITWKVVPRSGWAHVLMTHSTNSTRSSAVNTPSSSMSPIATAQAASHSPTGTHSTTCSPSPMPSMKLLSVCSQTQPAVRSTSTTSKRSTPRTQTRWYHLIGTQTGRACTWAERRAGTP